MSSWPRWPASWISLKIRTFQKRRKLNFYARHVEYCPTKTSVRFFETSGNLTINSFFQDYTHLDDHTYPSYEMYNQRHNYSIFLLPK